MTVQQRDAIANRPYVVQQQQTVLNNYDNGHIFLEKFATTKLIAKIQGEWNKIGGPVLSTSRIYVAICLTDAEKRC